MDIDGTPQKQLYEALLSAFPTRQDLELMVSHELNENLSSITGIGNLQHTIFELIRWSIAKGRLQELVVASLKQNSQNPQLKRITQHLGFWNDLHVTSDLGIVTNAAAYKPSCFLVCIALPNPNEFYGRIRERMTLLDRTSKGGCTSIVGPRRIGKTWLMSYLQLVAFQELGTTFCVGYLDATTPDCATIAGFTAAALEALGTSVPGEIRATLNLTALQERVKELQKRQQTPVLCIDEFEGFGNHPVFNFQFFLELRSLTYQGLCLVTASKTPLIDIVDEISKTSPFFNVFETLKLKPFYSDETEQFITSKGMQARFTEQERDYLRKHGSEYGPKGQHWPPLRLQLAGKMLAEDKYSAMTGYSAYYRPNDVDYWQDFEVRLQEKYRAMVKQ